MNLLITISLLLAVAVGMLMINRCLEWWERKSFEKGISDANRRASPVLMDPKLRGPRRKRAT